MAQTGQSSTATPTGTTPPVSVAHLLATRAASTPHEVIVSCGDGSASARELNDVVSRLARGLLSIGLVAGDRVAVLLPNSLPFVEMVFGCARAGLVQVPLNVYLKGDFLSHQLIDSGAVALVTDDDGAATVDQLQAIGSLRHVIRIGPEYDALRSYGGLAPLPRIAPDDLAVLMYTSGTTGPPKACMLSHAYQINIARAYNDAGWVSDYERVFTALPLYHAGGQLAALISAIRAGGSVIFPERFSASRFMADAAAHNATQVIGVMAMASAILATDAAGDPPRGSIDKAIWIPLDEPRQKQFEARFGCRMNSEGYGQSEATAICLNPFDAAQRRVGTLGRPTSIVDVAVVDDDDQVVPDGQVGEIVVRPRVPGAIFSGYWQRPAETLAAWRNLWYHTGDYGRRDPDGFLSFVDRKKDAVRRRGENVSSVELERIVMSHPQIAEAAVHAVSSALGEDDIKVCIVAPDRPAPEDLFTFFEAKLPYFAVPRYVEFRDELPKNGVGRVLKHQLRAEGITPMTIDLEAMGFVTAKNDRRG
jgi:carnitine-CoA ligase